MKARKLILFTGAVLLGARGVALAEPPIPSGTIVRPMTLSGMLPTAYFDVLQNVFTLSEQQNWQQALPLLEQIVKAYPYDGETWHLLGNARMAVGKPLEAGEAYTMAARYGLSSYSDGNAADAARAFAKAGQYERALSWLSYSLEELTYREPDKLLDEQVFDPLRHMPGFRALSAGSAKLQGASRTARVQADLDYFVRRYSLYRFPRFTPSEISRVRQAAIELRPRLGDLSDDQIVVEFQRLSAFAPGGHNTAPSLYGYGMDGHVTHSIPLDLYLFPEGLFVIGAADEKYKDLIGAKVLRFGSILTEDMLERVAPLIDRDPHADGQVVEHAPGFLSQLPVIRFLGATTNPDNVSLALLTPGGSEKTVEITGTPPGNSSTFHPSLISKNPAPISFDRVQNHYWFADITPDAVYVQFNQVVDQPKETLLEFGVRLRRHLEDRGFKNLIVDARFNGGGNTFKYLELLRTMVEFDAQRGHHLYYVEGRATFSAAVNFTTEVRKLTHAVFVGEPASSPRAAGDPAFVTLPNTGIQVRYATDIWSMYYPDDDRTWIPPDIPVVLTAADYFDNRDTVLETITKLIGEQ